MAAGLAGRLAKSPSRLITKVGAPRGGFRELNSAVGMADTLVGALLAATPLVSVFYADARASWRRQTMNWVMTSWPFANNDFAV